jgi:hypothetical protein
MMARIFYALAILALTLLLSRPAPAQNQRLEIHGFHLGMTERDADKHSKLEQCKDSDDVNTADRTCTAFFDFMDFYSPAVLFFFNDKLGAIYVQTGADRNEIIGAMAEKFGGAPRTDDTRAFWRRGNQVLRVERVDGTATPIWLESDAYWKEVTRRKKMKAAKDSKKL